MLHDPGHGRIARMKDPLALLIGTWRGTVEVTFPTIESSTCEEEMRFEDVRSVS